MLTRTSNRFGISSTGICSDACVHAKLLQLCPTLVAVQTRAYQDPLPRGSSRHECWSGLPCPLQGIFQILGLKLYLLCFLHWQAGFLPSVPLGKPILSPYTVSKSITAFGKIVSIEDVMKDLMCHGRQNYSLHVNTSNFFKL